MDHLIYALAFAVISFLLFLPCKLFDPRLTLGAGVLFAVYIGLDDLATTLPRMLPFLDPIGARWNWSGKFYSIVLATAVILLLRLKPTDTGLTLPRKNIKTSLIATLLLVMMSCSLGFLFSPPVPNAETIAFQLLMPGLAEELAYRGVAPAILLGLMHGKAVPDKTPWAAVMATALAFGVWHGLGYADGSFSFEWLPASFPFLGGIAYGWLRFHSGSLLFPIVAHGLGNTVFYIASIY